MSRTTVLAILLAALLAGLAHAQTPAQELEEEHVLATTFVTPHVPWAKPYARGTIRALFFVCGRGTAPREIIELMQRFDLAAQAVYFTREGKLHGGPEGEKRLLRLLGEPYDAYVFGNIPLSAISTEAQYRIMRAVVGGRGLVCIGPRPEKIMSPGRKQRGLPPFLAGGMPLASLPGAQPALEKLNLARPTDADAARAMCSVFRLGQGRGVHISYQRATNSLCPKLDFSFSALCEYEYWSAFVGRALLWAAGREPRARLKLPASPLLVAREQLLRGAAVAEITAPQGCDVSLALRRSDGRLFAVSPARQGEKLVIAPGALPAGQYFLECIARRGGKVEDFAAIGLRVTSADGVDELALDRDFAEVGERLSGTVALRGQVADKTLRISLRDNWGREVSRMDLAPRPGKVPFSLIVPPWATMLTRVEAALLDENGAEIERRVATLLVPHRKRGRFNFVMWDAPADALGYYACQRMRQVGITVSLGSAMATLAANDIAVIRYSTRILANFDKNHVMRPTCWNNSPEIDRYIESIVTSERTVAARKQGAFLYSLGDETTTQGCCLHPKCLAAYRQWLKGQYGTIQALNAEWGSNYRSFDEVNVLVPGDNYEEEAKKRGLYARWYDRQAFARYNFCRYCEKFVRRFKQLDPQAIVGFEGAGRFGEDYQEIVNTNGFWSPYPDLGDEIIRSIAPRAFIRSNWMGYRKTADPLCAKAWRMILNGADSVWWWRWDGIGLYHGYLAPHLDLWPATRELAEEMRVVREGLGDLLLAAQMEHDGIALLYSMPSAWAGKLEESNGFPDVKLAHQAFVDIIHDLGMQFRYITVDMLEQGVLDKGEFRLLILPFCQALSDRSAQAIRRFAAAGGTVLADLRPGVFTGHCRPREAGVLDELFGVRQRVAPQAKVLSVNLAATLEGKPLSLSLEATRADGALALAGARALAQADGLPLLIVNRVGRGRAVLLNFSLSSYPSLREQQREEPLLNFARQLFACFGLTPPLAPTDAQGKPLRFTQIVRWKTGDVEIVALRRTGGEDPAARITLPAPRHVYAIQPGRYLGRTTAFAAQLPLGRARFFALLPYRVPRAAVDLSPPSAARGATVRARLALPLARGARARHAFLVTLRKPDGSEAAWGRRVVLVRYGQAAFDLHIAYDDPPGRWTVAARELFSGVESQAALEVR